ncbi:MAG TPA: hypothetical protein VHF06_01705 [Pseudonocardiaceae bacterium]|jgi:hypothetical protein|nr:hypothetical protein [Pseudonocardiaceae bacterium]
MSERPRFPPGGRRVRRPAAVQYCLECGELAGRGYPECPDCADAVDGFWLADWDALLAAWDGAEADLAEEVLADTAVHPWTCVDWAMTVIDCPSCRTPLGEGPVGCVLCRIADETRWAWEHAAPAGSLTANEHALREARVVLRAPHRNRATVVLTWRLSLPFLLAGEVDSRLKAPWLSAYLRAGRYDELAAAGSYAQLTGTPELPWR